MPTELPHTIGVSNVFRIAKSTNTSYLIDIICPGHNFGVQVDMPEQLALAVTSDWESRLPSGLTDVLSKMPIGGNLGESIANLLGNSPHVQALSFQMWSGTSPIEIPLTVLFDAENNALEDVYKPIIMLQSLILPVEGRLGVTWLTPPGPDVGFRSNESSGYGIHIKLGRMMLFMNCILVSANAIFDSKMDSRGYPISGQLDLVFRTSYMYGRSDWLRATLGT